MKTQRCRFFEKWTKRWTSNRWRHRSQIIQQDRFNQMVALAVASFLGLVSHTVAEETPAAVAPVPARAMSEVLVTGQKDAYKPESASSPKYTAPLLDTPQTINVIPQAAMEQQNATTLRDVLRNVPGISIQAGEGGVPNGDNLSIRGYAARTDIFVDGVRDFGGYTRDSFNLSSVEVVKGPSSTYSGRGATGGSVNLVSKEPGMDKAYNATVGMGSDQFRRVTADINQPFQTSPVEGTALRLNAMWNDSNAPGREEVNSERFGVAPTVSFGLGTPTETTVGFFHLQQDNLPDYGIPWVPANNVPLARFANDPAPVDYRNFYGLNGRDYEKTNTDLATIQLKHQFNDNVDFRYGLRYGKTYRDSVVTSPRFASTATAVITREFQSRDQKDTILSNVADVTTKFKTGLIDHTLLTGVEMTREDSTNYGRTGPTPAADLYNPNPNDFLSGSIARTGARTETTAKSAGAYAFDTLALTNQLEVTGGLRFDSFDVNYLSVSSAATPSRTNLDRLDEMLSWRGGLVYKPMPNGSVYAAYGTSYNPSAEALTLANTATATNNINVAPEKNRSVEVGTKWDLFGQRAQVTAALFRTDKTNARTEDPVDATDVIVLDGEQRVQGYELGITGSPTENLHLLAGYTYLDSKIRASKNQTELGRPLSNTPRHSASFWSTYRLPAGFEVGAGAQYVGDRFNSTATSATSGPRRAPGYFLADAMAAYRINNNITLRVNLYNLTDKEYIDRVGGGHFVPGAKRSGTVTTEVKF